MILSCPFHVHETLGAVVSEKLALPRVFGLGPDHLGELVVWAFLSLFLVSAVATTHLFSRARVTKQASRHLFMLLIIYAIPGVVLDAVHAMVHSQQAQRLLTILEDGGELVAASIIVWFVLLTAKNEQQDASQERTRRED
jgi:hypothetical protein